MPSSFNICAGSNINATTNKKASVGFSPFSPELKQNQSKLLLHQQAQNTAVKQNTI